MQQTTSVAVLATHLAQTDHRALSQAWYSALHLADHAPPPRARTVSVASPRAFEAATSARAAGRGSPKPTVTGTRAERASGARDERRPHEGGERPVRACAGRASDERSARHDPAAIARSIEDGIAQRELRGGAVSFTIQAAGGRVHVVVRSDGARTRVVAVCAPPLREHVERALAYVRFMLVGSGVRAEVA